MEKLFDELDHPVVFVFFLLLALKGMGSIVTYLAKRSGINGLANLEQHS